MKLDATVKISVVNIYDEMQDVIVRTRSYTIINSDELKKALNNMRNDIGEGKYINPPKWVSIKKACINIKNQDDKCFQYAIQCGYHKIYEKSHPGILDHYKRIEDG